MLVETKLSTNHVVAGYTKQLETYKEAEQTVLGTYVVIDVGHRGKKAEKLLAIKNEWSEQGRPTSEIVLIDGTRRKSASKL